MQHEHLPRENYKNIQYLFKVLAFSHSLLLTFLLQFLNLVTTYSEQNKMTASNLAIVITPNVVRVQKHNVVKVKYTKNLVF